MIGGYSGAPEGFEEALLRAELDTPPCVVCGSTATHARPRGPGRPGITLCRGHVGVCNDHLADPCGVCDTA